MKIGSRVKFHNKVNIDPLGSHCSLCGRKTASKFWFPIDWDDKISLPDTNPLVETKNHKGYYPVGSECAKKFESGILIERN
jgi:hypothetical protein